MADVAMLVVGAGHGEFEAGVSDHGWFLGGKLQHVAELTSIPCAQRADLTYETHDTPGTNHHLMLAKSLSMSKVIVVVNKMDDRSVNYSQVRFNVPSPSLLLRE
jgi:translation elongation factor EF-1alpha